MQQRYLIVNADDFGLSHGVNRGIIESYERGIVTSASLMVRYPAAAEAAAYARGNPKLSVGLHIDLGEWVYADGHWQTVYEVVPWDDSAAIKEEVTRQLEAFRYLLGRNPTHLDSHQHIHRADPGRSALLHQARQLGIPLRCESPTIRYCGDFYGQASLGRPYPEAISFEALLKIFRALSPGFTEMGCHPGYADDLKSMYREERAAECSVLCDPRVSRAIQEEKITLCTFRSAPV